MLFIISVFFSSSSSRNEFEREEEAKEGVLHEGF